MSDEARYPLKDQFDTAGANSGRNEPDIAYVAIYGEGRDRFCHTLTSREMLATAFDGSGAISVVSIGLRRGRYEEKGEMCRFSSTGWA